MLFTLSRKTAASGTIDWIVPNLIVQNDVNLIDGRKSSGKSSVVAKILGDWNTEGDASREQSLENILWISSEEPFDSVIKPRLMQYGIDEDQVTTIDYRNGQSRKPELPTDLSQLADFMGLHGINALVIDPFQELKPVEWSINDGDQMRSYMTSLVSLCSRLDCTAFLMRHMRKSTGNFSGDDGIGSVQIKASIRHPLRIDVTEEKIKRRFLSVEESNIARPMMPLQFDFADTSESFGKLEWQGHKDIAIDEIKKLAESKVKRSKLTDAKVLLLEALKEGEKSSKVLIQEAKDYGIGDRTLDDAKADLGILSIRKTDQSTGLGHWVWALPADITIQTQTITGENDMQNTLEDLPEMREMQLRQYTPEPDPTPEPAAKPKRERKPKPAAKPKAIPAAKKPTKKASKTAEK